MSTSLSLFTPSLTILRKSPRLEESRADKYTKKERNLDAFPDLQFLLSNEYMGFRQDECVSVRSCIQHMHAFARVTVEVEELLVRR